MTSAPSPDREPVDPALAEEIESAFEELGDVGDLPAQADSDPADAAHADAAPAAEAGAEAGAPQADSDPAEPEADADSEAAAPTDPLAEATARNAELTDELARARADLYNLNQEYQGFVRRSREAAAGHREAGAAGVVEALIPVLDEAELARQHGDLTGPFETTVTKLESILADKFSLVRFGEVGEVFDPTVHEALMAVESTEVTEPTVAMVLQPGYRLGERVVRAARVQVANPA